jgi:hypothetical protein
MLDIAESLVNPLFSDVVHQLPVVRTDQPSIMNYVEFADLKKRKPQACFAHEKVTLMHCR